MTLSDRIAALSAPDRATKLKIECEIARVLFDKDESPEWMKGRTPSIGYYLSSIDAALTLASPALRAHTMAEAQKLLGPRGFTVGKFTEALAIAICVVALRDRGL